MTARRFLAVFAALVFASHVSADIVVGDTREEVLRQLGFPASVAKRGNHEYFVYPKGGRVEFLDGKVSDFKGTLPPAAAAPAPAPAPAKEPAAPAAAPAPVKATPTPAAPPATKAPAPADAAPPVYDASAATAALSSHIEKMDTPWGAAPAPHREHSPLDSVPEFLLGLVIRFGLTVGALKLAFKYWEMDAFWKGIFAIAGIDLALHALLGLLGPATSGLTTMSAVENGIPGVVLIFTINRFCFNKRLQNAVATAAAVKVVVTLLYIFGALAMLNLAFG
ncbi:MAG: hypothetical protein NTV51_29815 [Verrucomicrobia bacterium]|nr:hypothetical protein [Verrucomicrobiota bacterium]